MEWLTDNKIPLGKSIKTLTNFLNDHAAWLFDFISNVLGFLIEGLIDLMLLFPPLVLIALLAAGAYWLHRSWVLSLGILLSMLLIINLGYWEETIQTLSLVVFSTAVCMAVGVPVGIASAHRPWLYTGIRPVLDLMQTIPTFVYLIPTLILFGLGVVPGLISTVIFAIPAPIRTIPRYASTRPASSSVSTPTAPTSSGFSACGPPRAAEPPSPGRKTATPACTSSSSRPAGNGTSGSSEAASREPPSPPPPRSSPSRPSTPTAW